jgi:hypothetical protein
VVWAFVILMTLANSQPIVSRVPGIRVGRAVRGGAQLAERNGSLSDRVLTGTAPLRLSATSDFHRPAFGVAVVSLEPAAPEDSGEIGTWSWCVEHSAQLGQPITLSRVRSAKQTTPDNRQRPRPLFAGTLATSVALRLYN